MAVKILVAGDVMIDRYLHGCVEQPNPDGRGAVFRVDRVQESLGGAAAVARIVRGLGASVFLLGVAGKEAAGRRLIELLDAVGVSHRIMLAEDRVTTLKERRVTAGRLLPDRVDYESRNPIGCQEAHELVETASRFGLWDVVLVSD
jgi:bifunctional ADP-heptose synthase (sugar kinase/adenylyltransferase)